jgi:hypothetical protein
MSSLDRIVPRPGAVDGLYDLICPSLPGAWRRNQVRNVLALLAERSRHCAHDRGSIDRRRPAWR